MVYYRNDITMETNMNLELKKINLQGIEFFQQKMVESFSSGVMERFGNIDAAPIPPEDDLSQSLKRVEITGLK